MPARETRARCACLSSLPARSRSRLAWRPWPPPSANNLAGGEAMIKIWGRISSINVRKVVLAAQWLDIPFQRIDAGHEFGIVKTPEYLAKNPTALTPLLEHGDFQLWESNV